MKCDIHVHSVGSPGYIPGNVITKKYKIRESYVTAEHQYKLAKSNGMDLVTLSDHDSISEAKRLVELYPGDTFMSCEYMIKGKPGEQGLECLVLDLDEKLHDELMIVKEHGVEEFSKFIRSAKLAHALAHISYPVDPTGPRLTVDNLKQWSDLFDVIETKNGDGLRVNEVSEIIATYNDKPTCGGSDDHGGIFTGKTYTVAPDATNKEEFLQHFKEGKINPAGEGGSIEKVYLTMYSIGKSFLIEEKNLRKEIGYFKYCKNDPMKAFLMLAAPIFLSPGLKVASQNYKRDLEKRCSKLELKYLDYVTIRQKEIFKEKTLDLKKQLDEEENILRGMVSDRSEYIPKGNLFIRMLVYLFENISALNTEFRH